MSKKRNKMKKWLVPKPKTRKFSVQRKSVQKHVNRKRLDKHTHKE